MKKLLNVCLILLLTLTTLFNVNYSVYAEGDDSSTGSTNVYTVGTDGNYSSISAALGKKPSDESESNPTVIVLMSNIVENITIEQDRYITLDLNDHVLKGDGTTSVITNNGTLTITDNSESKTTRYWDNKAYESAYDDETKIWTLASDQTTPTDYYTVGGCITGGEHTNRGGGGIYNCYDKENDITGHLTIEKVNIVGNYAENGGGVFNAGYLTLNNAKIVGNACAHGMSGGGIYNIGIINMKDSTISYNIAASGYGGGIYSVNQNSLDNVEISHNNAGNGAGIYDSGRDWNQLEFIEPDFGTSTIMSNSTISYNTASGNGAGIYAYAPYFYITNSSIINNTITNTDSQLTFKQDFGGAGIYDWTYIRVSGTVIINNNTTNNKADNLFLKEANMSISIDTDDKLSAESRIGVTYQGTLPTDGYADLNYNAMVADGWEDYYYDVFTADEASDTYPVIIMLYIDAYEFEGVKYVDKYVLLHYGALVAQIGDTKYETLAAAMEAVPTDGTAVTLTLLSDTTGNIEIPAGANLTIDLNGHTLTGDTTSDSPTIQNLGTLTIKDTSTNKTGTVTGVNGNPAILNSATAIITDGTFSGIIENKANNSNANLVINGGTFNSTTIWTAGDADNNKTAQTTIKAGLFKFNDNAFVFGESKSTNKSDSELLYIEGGHFSAQPDSSYIVEGKSAVTDVESYKALGYNYTIADASNVIITATSKLNNTNTTFATITGGGRYTVGDKVTLKATPADSGATFDGWYASTDTEFKTKLSDKETYTFDAPIGVNGTYSLVAKYTSTAKVDITVGKVNLTNGDGTVTVTKVGDTTKTDTVIDKDNPVTETNLDPGTQVTITAQANASTEEQKNYFLYWKDTTTGSILGTNTEITVDAIMTKKVEAVFSSKGAAVVEFQDENGNFLQSDYYFSDEGNKVTEVVAPSKRGQSFIGWAQEGGTSVMTNSEVGQAIAQAADTATQQETYSTPTVQVKAVYGDVSQYEVVVHIIDTQQKTIGQDITLRYNVGESRKIYVPEYDGCTFLGFSTTNSSDNIFTKNYSFTVSPEETQNAIEYWAIYDTSKEEEITRLASLTVLAPVKADTNVTKFDLTMSWSLPSGATLNAAGFYYSKNNLDTLNAASKTLASTLTDSSGTFTAHIKVTGDNTAIPYLFRAYIIYTLEDGEKQVEIVNGDPVSNETTVIENNNYSTAKYMSVIYNNLED